MPFEPDTVYIVEGRRQGLGRAGLCSVDKTCACVGQRTLYILIKLSVALMLDVGNEAENGRLLTI
jgi:hypothetical protein